MKTDSLNLKVLVDEIIEVYATRNDVAPDPAARAIVHLQRPAKFLEDLAGEKSDLPFVILPVIEIAIAANAMTCDAFDHWNFQGWMGVRFASVMAEEIMSRGNVKVTDFH
jgi:hypothetical protein